MKRIYEFHVVEPIDVPCQQCGPPVGAQCQRRQGGAMPINNSHWIRRFEAGLTKETP